MKTMAPTLTYLSVLSVAGVVGNTIVLVVYSNRFPASTIRTYILAMAVVDLLISVVTLPMDIVEISLNFSFTSTWCCKSIRTVRCFLVMLSACVLVAVSLDRRKAVCTMRPAGAVQGYSPKGARVPLLVSGGISLVLTAPYSVLVGRQTLPTGFANVTGVACAVQDRYRDSKFHFVYNVVLAAAFVLCVVLMTDSYSRIGIHLWRHKKHTAVLSETRTQATAESSFTASDQAPRGAKGGVRADTPLTPHTLHRSGKGGLSGDVTSSSEGGGKIKSRTTSMLFVVTVVFVVNFLPYVSIATAKALSFHKVDEEMDVNVHYIFKRSFYVNCAIIWLIYSFCSARFRRECCLLLARKSDGYGYTRF